MLKQVPKVIDPQILAVGITVLAVGAGTVSFHLSASALEKEICAELRAASTKISNGMIQQSDAGKRQEDPNADSFARLS